MRIVRPVVQTMSRVSGQVRDLGRLQQVAAVLVRHGLGMLVAGLDVPGIGPAERRFAGTPERITAALQELGPTFVKLGQVMSTRTDVLPPAYIEALEQLQDDVAPLPFATVEAQLQAALGPQWRERVARFDEAPLATASIAQVHRATLLGGEEVVLKVQRPNIAAQIRSDLHILNVLARRALVEYPEVRAFDPLGVLDEFEASITSELDFAQEARHMRKMARNLGDLPFVKVPAVFEALSSRTVLCMEFLAGVKIRDARAAGFDMQVVGQRYLTAAYDMLFKHGFFHGDLHPGNVLVLPGEVLGLLDFGMVGRLSRDMRNNIISIIFGLQRGDYRTIARLYYDIAIKDGRVDYNAVEAETIAIMEEHWSGESVTEMQLGPYVVALAAAASRHGARVPRAYTMFFKAVLTSEGLAKALIPEVDPIQAAEPYIKEFLRERFGEDRLKQDAFYNFLTLSSLGRRLPVVLSQAFDDYEHNRMQLLTRDPDLDRRLARQDAMVNRAVTAMLTVAAFGAGTAFLARSVYTWIDIGFGVLFYLAGAGLFVVTATLTLRSLTHDAGGRG
jgi:ubiquinone biosynthesis protein